MTQHPTPSLAARRRVMVWLPLFLLGAIVYLASSASVGFNSLTLVGAAAIIAGVVGVASEVGK